MQSFINGDEKHNQEILSAMREAFEFRNDFDNCQFWTQLTEAKSKIFVHLIQSRSDAQLASEIKTQINVLIDSLNQENAFQALELREIKLPGMDLSNLSLLRVTMRDVDLSDINATGLKLHSGSLKRVNLKNAILNNSYITFSNLEYVDLHNASFMNAKIGPFTSTFSDWHNTNWFNATFSYAQIGTCNLTGANFSRVHFSDGAIEQCILTDTNFKSAQFKDTLFLDNTPRNLSNDHPHLKQTQIKKADLNAAVLVGDQVNMNFFRGPGSKGFFV